MRLFLGAHYDTLPAPTFFSHLCARPRGSERSATPKQTLVWTTDDKTSGKEIASTPTERTSGDSETDSDTIVDTSDHVARLPWETSDEAPGSEEMDEGRNGEDDEYGAETEGVSSISAVPLPTPPPEAIPSLGTQQPSPPSTDAPPTETSSSSNASTSLSNGGMEEDNGRGIEFGFADQESEGIRSPGGIMNLFSSAGRCTSEDILRAASASGAILGSRMEAGVGAGAGRDVEAELDDSEPPTASQVLAARGGRTKRLNLAKRMSRPKGSGAALKGKRFDLMALPADSGRHGRRERGFSGDGDTAPSEDGNIFCFSWLGVSVRMKIHWVSR